MYEAVTKDKLLGNVPKLLKKCPDLPERRNVCMHCLKVGFEVEGQGPMLGRHGQL